MTSVWMASAADGRTAEPARPPFAAFIAPTSVAAEPVGPEPSGPPAQVGGQQGFTVETRLSASRVVDARLMLDGQALVYVVAGPQAGSSGADLDQLQTRVGRLFVRSTGGDDPEREYPGTIEGARYWLAARSPDGSRLLAYEVLSGRVRLVVLDLRTLSLTRPLEAAPEYGALGEDFGPIWLNDDAIALTVLPEGLQPAGVIGQRHHLERQLERAGRAWRGGASASVIQTVQDDRDLAARPGLLVEVELGTGRTTVLAEGAVASLRRSPSGRYVAGLRVFALGGPLAEANLGGGMTPRAELTVVDLERRDGAVRRFPGLNAELGSLVWAHDSDRLAVFARPLNQPLTTGRYHALDARSGEPEPISTAGLALVSERERGLTFRPELAAWVGDRLLVAARRTAATTEHLFLPQGDRSGGRIDWCLIAVSDPPSCPTVDLDEVSPRLGADQASGPVVLAAGRPYRVSVAGVDPLTAPPGRSFAPAPTAPFADQVRRMRSDRDPVLASSGDQDRQAVVLGGSGRARTMPLEPGEALVDLEAASGVAVSAVNGLTGWVLRVTDAGGTRIRWGPGERPLGFPRRELIAFTGADGTALGACLTLPRVDRFAGPPPVILDLYPNNPTRSDCPDPAREPDPALKDILTLSEHGYAVLTLPAPYRLLRTPGNPLGGLRTLADSAVAEAGRRGLIDPDRVGAYGFSQGGMMALWLATQSPTLDAVVAGASWSEYTADYFGGRSALWYQTYPEQSPLQSVSNRYDLETGYGFGGQPMGDRLFEMIEASPLYRAHEIEADVLLMMGDADPIPIHGFELMYSALERAGKPARFVRFAGEGHSLASPGNVRRYWTEMFETFDRAFGTEEGER